jgi:hypothetical protein
MRGMAAACLQAAGVLAAAAALKVEREAQLEPMPGALPMAELVLLAIRIRQKGVPGR